MNHQIDEIDAISSVRVQFFRCDVPSTCSKKHVIVIHLKSEKPHLSMRSLEGKLGT
jgi:hypothetical protein